MQQQVSVKLFILLFLRYGNTSPAEKIPDRCIWFFLTASFFSVQQPLDLFIFSVDSTNFNLPTHFYFSRFVCDFCFGIVYVCIYLFIFLKIKV